MKSEHLRKLILSALLAALTCIATIVIQIPTAMQGYINLGDSFVLLCGWLLGPAYGFCAGAIGSAMADLLTGYMQYVPGTFVIKGLIALAAVLLYRVFKKCLGGRELPALLLSSLAAECIMTAGYFAYAILLMGSVASALTTIPGSLIQGAFGMVLGILLYLFLLRIRPLHKYFQ